MNEDEVKTVVDRLLRERFEDVAFQDATVESEQDFDGSSILRVTARFGREVPSQRLTDALHAIRSELLRQGEERFVFLSSEYPQDDLVEEDVE